MEKKPNSLIHANSPYLLQHAHNPVNWKEWSPELFEQAKQEQKLVLVSIGYAACHWCHVMEHETFEDEAAARLMNEHFICIKVDREERPDVDQVYMDAVQLMTGQGGWPLNCFTLPDGRPIYGGTYFRKEAWMDILAQLAKVWKEDPDKTRHYAERLMGGMEILKKPKPEEAGVDPGTPDAAYRLLFNQLDPQEGGLGMAPKFPMPVVFNFLLDLYQLQGEKSALAMTELTLRKMAAGGIYDQLGGGFARYAVDQHWFVPHFEKMLYDNAQLISLYSKAFQLTGYNDYLRIAKETALFLQRELMDQEARFFSSLDADSEGEEGLFYCWTLEELQTVLGAEATLFAEVYGCTEAGNWEERNILFLPRPLEQVAIEHGISEQELYSRLAACKSLLMAYRERRVRPGLDDKVILGWNALAIVAFTELHRVDKEGNWLQQALNCIQALEALHGPDGEWFRISRNGKIAVPAFHDDLALLSSAYLELGSVTGQVSWLHKAEKLTEQILHRFWINEEHRFSFAPLDGEALIVNKTEYHDNVIPSSSAVMAQVLYKLGFIAGKPDWVSKSQLLLDQVAGRMKQHPGSFAHWWDLRLLQLKAFQQWIITGPEAPSWAAAIPHAPGNFVFATTTKQEHGILKGRFTNGTSAYHCTGFSCSLPITDFDSFLSILKHANTIH